ncbi:MAG: phosphoadenosine phosphosulfate reductase family protein, partial [Actinomycetota bacterium]|nr:phosphoadenosine phosphosulfate reductase family protein [Actinomycetota bacterium]
MSKAVDERCKPRNERVPVGASTRFRPLDEAPAATNGNGHKPVSMIGGDVVDPERISAEVEEMGAQEAIAWAIETFGPKLTFAVSFQKTTSVIVDMAHRIDPGSRFTYVDTELLFPETYETRDRLADHYDIEFERFVQDNPPDLSERWHAGEWGPGDECCAPRKVATMRRALEGV